MTAPAKKKKRGNKKPTTNKKSAPAKSSPNKKTKSDAEKRKLLVLIANELNDKLGLDPIIDHGKLIDNKLLKAIKDNASEILPEDTLSGAVLDGLKSLKINHDKCKRAKDSKKKAPAKGKGGKAKAKVGATKQDKTPKKKSTREEALCKSLGKKYITIDEWAEATNKAYIYAGGADNLRQSLHVAKVNLRVLMPFNAVEVKTFDGVRKYRRAN